VVLKTPRLTSTAVLNDSASLLRRVAAPWLAVVWLSALPLRLMQAHFLDRVFELSDEAASYSAYLHDLALLIMLCLLLALLGRAVFVRALSLGLQGLEVRGLSPFRLPPGATAGYLYVALLLELLFAATAFTIITIPFVITAAALAAASFERVERPGLVRSLRTLTQHGREGLVLLGLALLFSVAFVLSSVNVLFLFHVGLWLAGGLPGLDTTGWPLLLSLGNGRFVLLALAGGWLAVEPFWLAAMVVYVARVSERETGTDLRLWFERIKGREAA
jgi:hypothetical protein